jgi:Tfp pilus assembly protein PilN
MPKINLAQETMRSQVIARRRKIIYVVSSVLLLIVAAVYAAGFFLTRNVEEKVAGVNQRIASLEGELRKKEPGGKEIKAFSSRLVNMKTALKEHTRWSQVLTELERLVLPNVTINSLKGGTEKNSIAVTVSTPTIEAAADLVVSLQNAIGKNETYFKDVTASSLAAVKGTDQATTSGFSTVLNLDVKPEAFIDTASASVVEPTPTPAVVNPLTP